MFEVALNRTFVVMPVHGADCMYCRYTSIFFTKLVPCLCALLTKHQHYQKLLIIIKTIIKTRA